MQNSFFVGGVSDISKGANSCFNHNSVKNPQNTTTARYKYFRKEPLLISLPIELHCHCLCFNNISILCRFKGKKVFDNFLPKCESRIYPPYFLGSFCSEKVSSV